MTGDIVETVVRGFAGSVTFANTFHYIMNPGSAAPDLATFSSSFVSTVVAQMALCLHTDYTFGEITTTVKAGPSIHTQYIDASQSGNHGVSSGLCEDYCYAVVIKRGDGLAGRSGKGRIFLSPVPNTVFDVTGLMVSPPAALAALNVMMLSNQNDSMGNVYSPVLFNPAGPGVAYITQGGYSLRAGIVKHRRYKV